MVAGERRAGGRQDRAARPVGGVRDRRAARSCCGAGPRRASWPCNRSSTRWPAGWRASTLGRVGGRRRAARARCDCGRAEPAGLRPARRRASPRCPSGAGTALVIDDADGADPVTWAWLAHVRRRRLLPLLLVVAVRDRGGCRRRTGHRPGARAAGRGRGWPCWSAPDRAAVLLERSGGNPLLLTELAGAATTAPDEVPGSLREAVTARLRRTGGAEPTLQAAAVLGAGDRPRPAGRGAADRAAGGVGAPRRRRAAGVPRRAAGQLAFRHELVRLAVAAGAGRCPPGLAAPAAPPSCCGPDRTRTRSNWPGTPGRAANGGWPPTALAYAADVALARLDLPGAERLLDEAIELGRQRRSCGCGAAGCGCRAATWTAPTRTPRRRWPPTTPARRSSCARGWPATGTTSTARSGSAGPPPRRPPTRRCGAAA